jgi:hypothetical protein
VFLALPKPPLRFPFGSYERPVFKQHHFTVVKVILGETAGLERFLDFKSEVTLRSLVFIIAVRFITNGAGAFSLREIVVNLE